MQRINILVTGGTGFIGKHLLRRLLKLGNFNITLLLRDGSNLDLIENYKNNVALHYHKSDYQSIDSLFKKTSFDYVFHLAAMSCYEHDSKDISTMIDSNIKFGTFILEAMKKYGCQYFINTSTYWQNYKDCNYEPICLYASTKKAFEDIVDYYCFDREIKAISLKLYDVYGYDDHRERLLNTLIKQKDNQVIDLTKGEQKLYMVFIDDVIDAYLTAMNLIKDNNKNHSVYGVYGNEKYSLREIIRILEEVTNRKSNINWGKKKYNQFQIMDPYVENKLDGWETKTPLREGLKIILNKS